MHHSIPGISQRIQFSANSLLVIFFTQSNLMQVKGVQITGMIDTPSHQRAWRIDSPSVVDLEIVEGGFNLSSGTQSVPKNVWVPHLLPVVWPRAGFFLLLIATG